MVAPSSFLFQRSPSCRALQTGSPRHTTTWSSKDSTVIRLRPRLLPGWRLGASLGVKATAAAWVLMCLLSGPASPADFFPNLSQARLEAGKSLLNRGELDNAITEFRTAIQLQPGNADAHYNLGYALGRMGDVEGAIAAYAGQFASSWMIQRIPRPPLTSPTRSARRDT